MKLLKWLLKLITLKPHFIIGGFAAPYMLRWFLIPRNPWFNVYLHKFLRDDDDRALHDHPWNFLSFMLKGAYVETRPCGFMGGRYVEHRQRCAPSIAYRRATDRHCVTLLKDQAGNPIPCWTVVVTGPKLREWGFWCPKGFVVWQKFCAKDDKGSVGKGCGE